MVLLGMPQFITYFLHLANIPVAGRILAILPFVMGLFMMWFLDYPFHLHLRREMSMPLWSLREYMAYNCRHNLLFVAVPVCLITGLNELSSQILVRIAPEHWLEPLALITSLLVAAVVFIVIPLVIVNIWKTSVLEDGPLKYELEELCRRTGIRFRKILMWHSSGVIANAGAMGVVPWCRYFLISDAIVQKLSPVEIRAVFAHEIGHIRGKHIPYMCMFGISTILMASATGLYIRIFFGPSLPEIICIASTLVIMLILWICLFGRISRRFERHSDVFGAHAAGCPEPDKEVALPVTLTGVDVFTRALANVAMLNCLDLHRHDFRHGSMAKRIDYLHQVAAEGRSMAQEDMAASKVRWMILTGLAVAIASLVTSIYFMP